jgi:hypothetical protein
VRVTHNDDELTIRRGVKRVGIATDRRVRGLGPQRVGGECPEPKVEG